MAGHGRPGRRALELALENVRRNLDAAGKGVTDLVKVTWHLVAAPECRVEVDAWAAR